MIFQAWKNHEHGLAAEWVRGTWVCKRWRQVALDTAALWSSVIVLQRLADDPALEMQLDRAHGAALDLVVSCAGMSNRDLKKVLNFILSRTKAIERLDITSYHGQQTSSNSFIKDTGIAVVFLWLNDQSRGNDHHEWELTRAILPRLRHLALNRVVPTPGALGPLLTLIHLQITNSFRGVHNLLAACPNLERLETDVQSLHHGLDEQPVVILPHLRHLSVDVDYSMHKIAAVLSSLRLPSLASFHIPDCEANDHGDFAIEVIPPNVTEVLPPIRHSRCLSLVVGGAREDLSLRGSSGDAFQDEPDREWSITMPSFADNSSGYPPNDELTSPEFLSMQFYYLARNVNRLLAHIPHLVNASNLVQLELHLAHGLPVARDWVRFFAPMSHLRTLGVGGVTLVSAVLTAFHTDPGMCIELQDVALCAPPGWVRDELRLCMSFREVVAGWARERVGTGTRLQSLTIRTPDWKNVPTEMYTGDGDSGNSVDDEDRGLVVGPGSSRSDANQGAMGLATKPSGPRDIAWLEDIVGEDVVVKEEVCFRCGAVYELPDGYPEWSNEETGGSGSVEPYFY